MTVFITIVIDYTLCVTCVSTYLDLQFRPVAEYFVDMANVVDRNVEPSKNTLITLIQFHTRNQ